MIVYGGYQDLRGSSNELWTYHFGKYFLSKNIIIIKGGGERERKGGKNKLSFSLFIIRNGILAFTFPEEKKNIGWFTKT